MDYKDYEYEITLISDSGMVYFAHREFILPVDMDEDEVKEYVAERMEREFIGEQLISYRRIKYDDTNY